MGIIVYALNPRTQKLRQEDSHGFKVRLGYFVDSKPT